MVKNLKAFILLVLVFTYAVQAGSPGRKKHISRKVGFDGNIGVPDGVSPSFVRKHKMSANAGADRNIDNFDAGEASTLRVPMTLKNADNGWQQFRKVAVVYYGHHYSIGVRDCRFEKCLDKDAPDDKTAPSWSYAVSDEDGDGFLEGGRGTRDFRITFSSHVDNIHDVLRKHNVRYDIFFHTWPSPIQEHYVDRLKPKSHLIANASSYAQAARDVGGTFSKLEALKLVNSSEYDAVIWTRPDIKIRYPLDSFSILASKINLPNREIDARLFKKECKTGDHIFVFATKYIEAYLNGSIDPGHYPLTVNPWITGEFKEDCPGWQEHFHLMSEEYGWALSEMTHKIMTDEKGPYYNYLPSHRKSEPEPHA